MKPPSGSPAPVRARLLGLTAQPTLDSLPSRVFEMNTTAAASRFGSLLLAAALSSCGGEDPPPGPMEPVTPVPTTVTVSPPGGSLDIGGTVQLSATVRDQRGNVMSGQTPLWSSDQPAVVSVDAAGLATALAPGSATITATVGSAMGDIDLVVGFQAQLETTLSTGALHSCMIDGAGRAYCWGGVGITLGHGGADSSEPVAVGGGHTFVQIGAEANHACGLTDDGRVICWGVNDYGQVDPNSSDASQPTPVEVPISGSVAQVAVGGEFNCALLDSGAVTCWGRNNEGQLGRGSTSAQEGPGFVSGELTFAQLGLGRAHGCGVTTEAVAYCWGRNNELQLGDGSSNQAAEPTAVATTLRFVHIAADHQSTCAVAADETAYCWGSDAGGLLGNGAESHSDTPSAVLGLTGVRRVFVGRRHACALGASGAAHCWGRDEAGELGTGTGPLDRSQESVAVAGGHAFEELSVGIFHTCGSTRAARCGAGAAISRPSSASGAARTSPRHFLSGADTAGPRSTPDEGSRAASGPTRPPTAGARGTAPSVSRACSRGASAFRTSPSEPGTRAASTPRATPTAGATTSRDSSVTGRTRPRSDPTPVQTDSSFVAIDAGDQHTCALTASGATYCWGDLNFGRFGDGGAAGSGGSVNSPVPGAVGVSLDALSVSTRFGCGIDTGGAGWCWGTGPLGSSADVRDTPTAIEGGRTWSVLSGGDRHACGVDATGVGYCWGQGYNGRLGQGSTVGSDPPVAVSGGLQLLDIAAGRSNSCAVTTASQVYCWGYGSWGELGNGTHDIELEPVAASLDATALTVSIATPSFFDSSSNVCALMADGRAMCWGWNDLGQTGNPTVLSALVPTLVTFP